MKKVHLVLGSGGARGMAHIGVIDVLEETGHEIISVTGCSMGAVVGGMYAAGYHNAYKEWMLKLTKTLLFKILDFTLTRQGFLKGERLFNLLQKVTGQQQIEDLRIPFVAVATDMVQNKEVYYRSGDMYKALRASIAIPGVFTPVLDNGQFLVDGGVLNPLPLNLVQKEKDEYIVAVNVNAAASPSMTTLEVKQEVTALWKWLNPIMQKGNKPKDLLPISEYSLRELLLSSYNMTQDRLASYLLKTYPPDILVEIPRNSCSTFEFYKAQYMIDLGRNACKQAIFQDEQPV
ncbi:MAG TPA: patatin-like phospholipase family protein [Flavisolibacter sp.]|nr:patatin-like phospholipase family protein [Flavisolibacter sp.]